MRSEPGKPVLHVFTDRRDWYYRPSERRKAYSRFAGFARARARVRVFVEHEIGCINHVDRCIGAYGRYPGPDNV